MNLICEYCGHEGEYGREIEFRTVRDGREVTACIDRAACDKRDEQNEREREAERQREDES